MLKVILLVATSIFCVTASLEAQTFEKISPNISFTNYSGYLTLADLDNDGDPEIIQTGGEGFNIFNNNDGIFQEPTAYPQWKGESWLGANPNYTHQVVYSENHHIVVTTPKGWARENRSYFKHTNSRSELTTPASAHIVRPRIPPASKARQ